MHHPSTGSLGVDSLHIDDGQSLDIFSQLNNRALSHEMQLNQIQRDLKHQSQKIKLEKQRLRDMKDKIRKEAIVLEHKQ